MSDQGGPSEAGWQPDPFGRHEYRYWDGSAWPDRLRRWRRGHRSPGWAAERRHPGDLGRAGSAPDG